MDYARIFGIIEKGLTLLPVMIDAGVEVSSVINNMKNLSANAQAGSVTDTQLDALEVELDAAISDFNTPLDE